MRWYLRSGKRISEKRVRDCQLATAKALVAETPGNYGPLRTHYQDEVNGHQHRTLFNSRAQGQSKRWPSAIRHTHSLGSENSANPATLDPVPLD